jgi:phytanoyl-CoA hydroxylase
MKVDLEHWSNNLLLTDQPGFDVGEYVRGAPPASDFDLRDKLEQWRDNGIVIFESCIDSDHIDALVRDISYLNSHRDRFELEVEHKGARHKLSELPIEPLSDTGIKFNCMENISLAARRLSLNRACCEFLRHVFQDAPVVIQSLTFWRGSEQPAHLDYPWVCVQTKLPHLAASWVPLEDIHADAGPLAYYPGSHKNGVIPPFDWGAGSLIMQKDSVKTVDDFINYLAEQIDKQNLKKQTFLPKRGDVLIWHGNLLHEGAAVNDRSRTRRSYVTHYTSLSAYPPDHSHRNACALKRFTSINGGFVFDHPWVNDARELPSWKSPHRAQEARVAAR